MNSSDQQVNVIAMINTLYGNMDLWTPTGDHITLLLEYEMNTDKFENMLQELTRQGHGLRNAAKLTLGYYTSEFVINGIVKPRNLTAGKRKNNE